MKFFVAPLLAGVLLVAATASAAQVDQFCLGDSRKCTSRFSGFRYVSSDLTDFTTQLVDQSFDFLFLSKGFDQHHKDRAGFEKLYRGISDQAWADAITLIDYQSQRGHRAILNPAYKQADSELRAINDPATADEFGSLKLAMEYEKQVAEVAHGIHKKCSVAHQHPAYDPDVAHFLDEKLIQRRSATVRQLTGYIHSLQGIVNVDPATRDLGLHMFDQHLKTVL